MVHVRQPRRALLSRAQIISDLIYLDNSSVSLMQYLLVYGTNFPYNTNSLLLFLGLARRIKHVFEGILVREAN